MYKRQVFASNINRNLIIYAPLQELELIKYAFDQPIKKRYFNLLQREVIAKNAPQIAEIITTNGTTATLNKANIIKDIWYENVGQIKRIFRGIKRKIYEKEKTMAKVMIEDDSDLKAVAYTHLHVGYSIIKDGHCGMEASGRTAKDYASDMQKYYEMSEEEKIKLGNNSKQKVKEFDFGVLTQKLVTIIENLQK